MVLHTAVCMAIMLYLSEIYIFKAPEFNNNIFFSQCVIIFAVGLVLSNLRVYPKDFRPLFPWGAFLMHFLMDLFVIEYTVAKFWLPLESNIIEGIPKIGQRLEALVNEYDGNCDTICAVFQGDIIKMIVSVLVSVFILICVLHATKIIDIFLLGCGLTFFVTDITYRFRRHVKKIQKSLRRRRTRRSLCAKTDESDEYPSN